jgi:hypothetical protein
MARRFERTNGVSPELDRAQRRIQAGQERGNPVYQEGAEITLRITNDPAALALAQRKIAHKLGRKPQGFKEISRSGDGPGTLMLDGATGKQATFSLKTPAGASATTHTYKLWVF